MNDPNEMKQAFILEPRNIQALSDYIWGYHHRLYLLTCSKTCKLTLHERRERCGYRSVNGFINREGEWLGCLRAIPVVYLETIGCDLDVLKAAVEQDQAEYDQAVQFTLHPKEFVIRIMAAMYRPQTLPEGSTLEEAEAEIRTFQEAHPNIRCCMSWPGLRTRFYEKGVLVDEILYRPVFRVDKAGVVFGETGLNTIR